MGKAADNKVDKRNRLLDSLYRCVSEKGIRNTSIDEICEKAGIAKGTFYLYYRGKEEISRDLNIQLSYRILKQAYETAVQDSSTDFKERAVRMADAMMAILVNDRSLLKVIRRDFMWEIRVQDLLRSKDPLIVSIQSEIQAYAKSTNQSETQIFFTVYALLTMISNTCYSCVVEGFPTDLDTMKPTLFEIIRNAL